MARMAAVKFDADWVINNDADEFWLAEQGTVRDVLAAVPRDTDCLEVPRVDMLPPRDTAERFYRIDDRSPGRPARAWPQLWTPKVCHRAYSDIRVAQGNHFVLRGGVRLAEKRDHALRIVHYPLRSLDQLERRIRRGLMALEPNSPMNPSSARRWRRLYRSHLQPEQAEPYYAERALSAEQIAAGIASGTLIRDTRIRDALRQLDPALVEAECEQAEELRGRR